MLFISVASFHSDSGVKWTPVRKLVNWAQYQLQLCREIISKSGIENVQMTYFIPRD